MISIEVVVDVGEAWCDGDCGQHVTELGYRVRVGKTTMLLCTACASALRDAARDGFE